ncbi:hypothetical protein [Pseudoalteromonas nigrifaciens]|uniref:hypothetical protein n=1 Tax=Pseudoalteromonas nigrifaciens TaxID=28109 RepID=UPI003FD56B03
MSNAERYLEKEKLVLRWLLFFDYTNRKIISSLLGVKDGGLSSFYRSLNKKNYILMVQDPISISANKLIILTKSGFDYALTLNDDIDVEVLKYKKTIPPTMVRHQIKLQSYLVSMNIDSYSVVSDKLLRKRFNNNNSIIPDCIAVIDGERIGVEMELTRKKPSRIYYKFEMQVNSIISNESVCAKFIYVFENKSMRDNYQRLFDEEKWPLIEMFRSRYLQKESSESEFSFTLNDSIRSKFKFITSGDK